MRGRCGEGGVSLTCASCAPAGRRYDQKLANSQMETAEAKKLLSALGNLQAEAGASPPAAQLRSAALPSAAHR